jgi:2-methylisocitrate lyase-like PEP mutase family enzyme
MDRKELSARFRQLHQASKPLLLPNAWDPGSARVIESCGAAAIATSSAALDWARGYPDADSVPIPVLESAVAEIERVISVPLTVDMEGGYSSEPSVVGLVVRAIAMAGAVGVNIEDGSDSPDLLCAKIAAAKSGAARVGADLFVNTRTDVYLRGLVAPEKRVAETIARGLRYKEAGADGLFVPGLSDPEAVRTIVKEVPLPLNLMVVPKLPPVAELTALGVKRVSAGAAIASAVFGLVRRAATQFLNEGRYEAMFENPVDYGEMNALFRSGASSRSTKG